MSQPDCASCDTIDQIEISYNVEAMSRVEAHRLITARERRVCLRILRRPDGTVVTADCWARLRAARRRGFLPFLGMMVLANLSPSDIRRGRTMGIVGPRPPVPTAPHKMGELVAPQRLMLGKMKRN